MLLEVLFEIVEVFVVGCAEAVEHHNGVWVGSGFAREVVVDWHAIFAVEGLTWAKGRGGNNRWNE